MKYINQYDYPDISYPTRSACASAEERKKGETTTFASSGCGLASAIMVLDRLLTDYDFTPEDAVEFSKNIKANLKIGTTYRIFAPAFAEKFNLKYKASNDIDELIECLKTGGAAIAHCHAGGEDDPFFATFTLRAHYIVVISVDENGDFQVLDPSYKDGKYDIPERQGRKVSVNGKIVTCGAEVLIEDTRRSPACYHLFWRK